MHTRQWGYDTVPSGGSSSTGYSFAFPTACVGVQITSVGGSMQLNSFSTSSFSYTGSGGGTFYWIAMGY